DLVERALERYRLVLGSQMVEVFRRGLTDAVTKHPAAAAMLERNRAAAEAARAPIDKEEEENFGRFEPPRAPVTWLSEAKRRELRMEGMKLVERLATKYAYRQWTIPKDDLVSLGAIGLMEALRHYDPASGALEPFARGSLGRCATASAARSRMGSPR